MASTKEMIEVILLKEISILYEKAGSSIGLQLEDVKKLEILSKIKAAEKNAGDDAPSTSHIEKTNAIELLKILKKHNDKEEQTKEPDGDSSKD